MPRNDPRLRELLRQVVVWRKTGDVNIPWHAPVPGHVWQIRLNDFPQEDLYTLIVDGEEIGDFNEWPDAWDRG